jgi:uncharacterized protein YjiK
LNTSKGQALFDHAAHWVQGIVNSVFVLYFLAFIISPSGGNERRSARFDLKPASSRKVELPKPLREISGLAMSPDGRLFAHNDEEGLIFEIDISGGTIVKKFSIGVEDDFEGLAIAGTKFFLVNSSGVMYAFSEGAPDETVKYVTYPTSLSSSYDVEGLCYDPLTASLLLACKGYSGLRNSGYKAVFTFSLLTHLLAKEPRFLLSINELEQHLGGKPFRPSSIEYNKATQSFFILDSELRSVAEVSPDGTILDAFRLDRSSHAQPEGMTFDHKGNLIISDEGLKRGTLTIYSKKR